MAFMTPQYTDKPFRQYEIGGEAFLCEAGDEPDNAENVTQAESGWYYRLSARGYMDCTEWSGPHETLDDAKRALLQEYEVDPDTGDALSDEEDAPGPICGAKGCSCWTKGECEEHVTDGPRHYRE